MPKSGRKGRRFWWVLGAVVALSAAGLAYIWVRACLEPQPELVAEFPNPQFSVGLYGWSKDGRWLAVGAPYPGRGNVVQYDLWAVDPPTKARRLVARRVSSAGWTESAAVLRYLQFDAEAEEQSEVEIDLKTGARRRLSREAGGLISWMWLARREPGAPAKRRAPPLDEWGVKLPVGGVTQLFKRRRELWQVTVRLPASPAGTLVSVGPQGLQLSPDGRMVAMLVGRWRRSSKYRQQMVSGGPELLVAGPAGGRAAALTPLVIVRGYAEALWWPPRGSTMCYCEVSRGPGRPAIVQVDLQGRELRRLSLDGGPSVSVSPNGRQVALSLSGVRVEGWQMRLIGIVTKPFARLPQVQKVVDKLTAPKVELWLYDAEMTRGKRLFRMKGGWMVTPAWSPDGRKIAVSVGADVPTGTQRVYVVEAH